jgi:hypothetical protein
MQPVASQRGMQEPNSPSLQMDEIQRLATVMAMMILGSPHFYGCQTQEAHGVLKKLPSPYLDFYPGDAQMMTAEEGFCELASAAHDWKRLEMPPGEQGSLPTTQKMPAMEQDRSSVLQDMLQLPHEKMRAEIDKEQRIHWL